MSPEILLRPPTVNDGAKIWRLVKESNVLDVNSAYLYLLLCKDFAHTCAVAEAGEELVGFVTAYRQPASPNTLFIWQVGVATPMRGQGIAKTLLTHLLNNPHGQTIDTVEATISPSNTASKRLFHSLAKDYDAPISESPCFDEDHFPAGHAHEAEHLFRVGPLHR